MKKIVFLSLLGLVLSGPVALAETSIYRLYNPHNHEHLYTTDANEKEVLYNQHGWGYEGIAWYAPDGGTPVYRLYNAGLQNHLYTSDRNEIHVLTSQHGWVQDNNGQPVFYSGGPVAIYRVYNQPLRGLHHWTTDLNEYNTLPAHGWQQEGIKFHAQRLGQPIQTKYAKGGPVGGQTPQQTPPQLPPHDPYNGTLYTYGEWSDAKAEEALNDPNNWVDMGDGTKTYLGPKGQPSSGITKFGH